MYLIIYLTTIIKPPYEQVLVGMGWIAGVPRETKIKRKKETVQETRVPWGREKKERKTPRRRVSPGPGVGGRGRGFVVPLLFVIVVSSLSSLSPPSHHRLPSLSPTLQAGITPVPLSRRSRQSTRDPPHEQLLVRLGAGGVLRRRSSPRVIVPRCCWFVVEHPRSALRAGVCNGGGGCWSASLSCRRRRRCDRILVST
jgi:hypothetical protein